MPAPDPFAIEITEWPDGRVTVTYHVHWSGNRTRKRRAIAILHNVHRSGWRCEWCHAPIPLFRRADARFCCEGCRKRAARERRMTRRPLGTKSLLAANRES